MVVGRGYAPLVAELAGTEEVSETASALGEDVRLGGIGGQSSGGGGGATLRVLDSESGSVVMVQAARAIDAAIADAAPSGADAEWYRNTVGDGARDAAVSADAGVNPAPGSSWIFPEDVVEAVRKGTMTDPLARRHGLSSDENNEEDEEENRRAADDLEQGLGAFDERDNKVVKDEDDEDDDDDLEKGLGAFDERDNKKAPIDDDLEKGLGAFDERDNKKAPIDDDLEKGLGAFDERDNKKIDDDLEQGLGAFDERDVDEEDDDDDPALAAQPKRATTNSSPSSSEDPTTRSQKPPTAPHTTTTGSSSSSSSSDDTGPAVPKKDRPHKKRADAHLLHDDVFERHISGAGGGERQPKLSPTTAAQHAPQEPKTTTESHEEEEDHDESIEKHDSLAIKKPKS